MAWSHYLGFGSSTFTEYEPRYANDSASVLARTGNFMGGCVHRYSDSRAQLAPSDAARSPRRPGRARAGLNILVYNLFVAPTPLNLCLKVQYALYIPPTWTAAKASAWYACDDLNLKTEGFWSAQVRDELSVSPTLCFGHHSFDCGRKPGGGVAGGAGARDSRGVRLGLDRRPRGGKSRSELYSGADAEP